MSMPSCAVRVTNLHALTLAARSYALLKLVCFFFLRDVGVTLKHALSQFGSCVMRDPCEFSVSFFGGLSLVLCACGGG